VREQLDGAGGLELVVGCKCVQRNGPLVTYRGVLAGGWTSRRSTAADYQCDTTHLSVSKECDALIKALFRFQVQNFELDL
jgi:hypothetical protein